MPVSALNDLRFEGGTLICNGQSFDPIGLVPLAGAPQANSRATNLPQGWRESEGFATVAENLAWVVGDHTAILSLDGEATAFELPDPKEGAAKFCSTVQGAFGAVMTSNRVWWVAPLDNGLDVTRWNARNLLHHENGLAVSRAGAVIDGNTNGVRHIYMLDPHAALPEDGPPEPLHARLDATVSGIALSEDGLLAVAGVRSLAQAMVVADSKSRGAGSLSLLNRRHFSRRALEGPDLRKASALEAIISSDADMIWRNDRSLRFWMIPLETGDFVSLGLSEREAAVFSAVWQDRLEILGQGPARGSAACTLARQQAVAPAPCRLADRSGGFARASCRAGLRCERHGCLGVKRPSARRVCPGRPARPRGRSLHYW